MCARNCGGWHSKDGGCCCAGRLTSCCCGLAEESRAPVMALERRGLAAHQNTGQRPRPPDCPHTFSPLLLLSRCCALILPPRPYKRSVGALPVTIQTALTRAFTQYPQLNPFPPILNPPALAMLFFAPSRLLTSFALTNSPPRCRLLFSLANTTAI